MLLKLTYNRESNESEYVTVIGDVAGILDLHWQLRKNYQANDGTAISEIKITNLDGSDLTESYAIKDAYVYATYLSNIED